MILTIDTCIRTLYGAAMNRRTAFQTELAVGLAVFLAHGSTDKPARAMLCGAYNAAGYDCVASTGMDYKTVNRRINATACLFEKLPVVLWAGKHKEDKLIVSLFNGLAPYEFFTVQDVMRFCSPERYLPTRQPISITPDPDALTAPGSGQQTINDMFRRAEDRGRRVESGHLHFVIPEDATRDELVALATKLLEIAGELLTA